MNPFERFEQAPMPMPDQVRLKAYYLAEAQRLHPDQFHLAAVEREDAGRQLAELNEAYEILSSNRRRLALLFEGETGRAPARTGRVGSGEAGRMMKIAETCRKADQLLERRKEAQGGIELAMLGGEVIEAVGEVQQRQAECAEWELELDGVLNRMQMEWQEGRKESGSIEALYQGYAYADKARQQLEERFLKLAECMG